MVGLTATPWASLAAGLVVGLVGAPVHAAVECRLALVLAMDVSSSVDAAEDALQRGGLAAALLAPEVRAALFDADLPVAVSVFEWSGRYNQDVIVDWTLIDGPSTLLSVAEAIDESERNQTEFPTAMGYALGFASGLLDRAPNCLHRTVDIAGDGENNEGFDPPAAYRHFDFSEVVVNGLAINGGEYEAEVDIVGYYHDVVITGPGAFVEIAEGFQDYERAMRRKLERELKPRVIGVLPSTVDDRG